MKRAWGAVVVVLTALALPAMALAGGWAVVTIDSLPDQIEAGRPVSLGFTVRQHGTHPADGLRPMLTATNPTSGESLNVAAKPDGVPGHYVATVTLPTTGTWKWTIDPGSFEAVTMPPLRVVSSQEVLGASRNLAVSPEQPALTKPVVAQAESSSWKWMTLASGVGAAACLVLSAYIALRGQGSLALRHEAR